MVRLKYHYFIPWHNCICLLASAVIVILFYFVFFNSAELSSSRSLEQNETRVELLLDLTDFKYVLKSNACADGSHYTSVLIVTSSASNVEQRRAIRRAYSNSELKHLGIVRVFLLATLHSSKTQHLPSIHQDDLLNESETYFDTIQGNFLEAYRNLTYKHVMGLQWAVTNCRQAKFIIKMDDDIAVDFYQLSELLNTTDDSGLLMGYVLRGLKPQRDPHNKWFVTRGEYRKSYFPPFLSGWMYVTGMKVAASLLAWSHRERVFWIDDTYVTGILASRAGVKHVDVSSRFAVHPEFLECCLRERLECDFLAGPVADDHRLMQSLKDHSVYCHVHKCPKRGSEKRLARTCVTNGNEVHLGRGIANVVPYRL